MQVVKKKEKIYYKEVLVKDLASLEETLKKKNTILLIYADWCLHCKLFKPTWNKVAQEVKQTRSLNQQVQLLSIESEVFKVLGERNPKLYKYISTTRTSKDIYFPKVMVFPKDKPTPKEYIGEKSEESMIDYITKYFTETSVVAKPKKVVQPQAKKNQPIKIDGNNRKRPLDKVRSKLTDEMGGVTAKTLPTLIDRMISKYLGL